MTASVKYTIKRKRLPAEALNFLDPMPTSIAFDLEPKQALHYFRSKGLRTGFDYRDVLGKEHAYDFTVAGLMDVQMLAAVRDKLDQAIAEGTTMENFRKQITPTLQAKGWWGRKEVMDPKTGNIVERELGSPHRLEMIFRTNMMNAYSAGQWEQIQDQKEIAPYLMYDAVDDDRTREDHAQFDGLVLKADDPFWKTHYGPNDYNCRCSAIQLTEDDLLELGITPSKSPKLKYKKWYNSRDGKTYSIPEGTAPSFNHNPGEAWLERIEQYAKDFVGPMPADLKAAYGTATTKQKQELEKLLKDLKNEPAEVPTADKQAEEQIKTHIDAGTPYLATAIKQVMDTKKGQAMTPSELLAYATEKAEKSEKNSLIQNWKKAHIAGTEGSEKAEAYYKTLPDEVQIALQKEVELKNGTAFAKEELAKIAVGEADKQAGIQKSLYHKWTKNGTASQYATPAELVTAIQQAAAEEQAKKEKSSVLSGYKKKVLAGQIPTPKQVAVFNALSDEEKSKVLAAIDAQKESQEPEPTPEPTPESEPVATDKDDPYPMAQYDNLSMEAKYTAIWETTGMAGLTDDDQMMFGVLPPEQFAKLTRDEQSDMLQASEEMNDVLTDINGKTVVIDHIKENADEAWAKEILQKEEVAQTAPAPAPAPTTTAPEWVNLPAGDMTNKQLYQAAYETLELDGAPVDFFPTPEWLDGKDQETLMQALDTMNSEVMDVYGMDLTALVDDNMKNLAFEYEAESQAEMGVAAPDDDIGAMILADLDKGIGVPAEQPNAMTGSSGATANNKPVLMMDSMVQTGKQKGSNTGGTFQDTNTGKQYYIKKQQSEDHQKNEILASELYRLAGIEVAKIEPIEWGGNQSTASSMIEGLRKDAEELKKLPEGVAEGFAVDAWLANWDAVGQTYDNMQIKDGKAYRIDPGGALLFRAQGESKGAAWGSTVNELKTLRDPATNPQAASVYGNITESQIAASVARVAAIDDESIKELVEKFGPGNKADKDKMTATLIARRDDLAKKYPSETKEAKEAKVEAIYEAKEVAKYDIEELDRSMLTAIKGISMRTQAGEPIEQKDIERLKKASDQLKKLTNRNSPLTDESKEKIKNHYQPWLDKMNETTKQGAGKPSAEPLKVGMFSGLKEQISIDDTKVKYEIPEPGKKIKVTSQEDAADIIKNGLGNMALGLEIKAPNPNNPAFVKLHDEHKKAIYLYTLNYYSMINDPIREGNARPGIVKFAKLLNEALSLAKPYKGEVSRRITLRGDKLENFIQGHIRAFEEGKPVRHLGFTSTTTKKDVFSGNIRLVINSKTGVNVKDLSGNNHEDEVLMKAWQTYMVKGVEKIDETYHIKLDEHEIVEVEETLEFSGV